MCTPTPLRFSMHFKQLRINEFTSINIDYLLSAMMFSVYIFYKNNISKPVTFINTNKCVAHIERQLKHTIDRVIWKPLKYYLVIKTIITQNEKKQNFCVFVYSHKPIRKF